MGSRPKARWAACNRLLDHPGAPNPPPPIAGRAKPGGRRAHAPVGCRAPGVQPLTAVRDVGAGARREVGLGHTGVERVRRAMRPPCPNALLHAPEHAAPRLLMCNCMSCSLNKCTYTYTPKQTHAHKRTYTHTYTHTRAHTHTHSPTYTTCAHGHTQGA